MKTVPIPPRWRNKSYFVVCTNTVCQGPIIAEFISNKKTRYPALYKTERDALLALLDVFDMQVDAIINEDSGSSLSLDDLCFPGEDYISPVDVDANGYLIFQHGIWRGDENGRIE